MENSTLKDIKILYPQFFFKLSPMQINQFEAKEWADEKASILSMENAYLSYAVAKQVNIILFSKRKLDNFPYTIVIIRHYGIIL